MAPNNCHVSSKYTYIKGPKNLRTSIRAVSCVPHPLNQPRSQVTGQPGDLRRASDLEALHQTSFRTTASPPASSASPPTSSASPSSRSRLRVVFETDAGVTAPNVAWTTSGGRHATVERPSNSRGWPCAPGRFVVAVPRWRCVAWATPPIDVVIAAGPSPNPRGCSRIAR